MKKGIVIFLGCLAFAAVTGFSVCTFEPVKSIKAREAIVEPDTLSAKVTMYKADVMATYYADKFNGRKTTSGEKFDNTKYTAAHKTLPFGTMVRVTNANNGKWVDVRINDRGPFSKKLEIDLTKKAFTQIANISRGVVKVKIEILE